MRQVTALIGGQPSDYTLMYFDWGTPKRRARFLGAVNTLRSRGRLPVRTISISSTSSQGDVFLAIPPELVLRDAVTAVSEACKFTMGAEVVEVEMPDNAYQAGMVSVRKALGGSSSRA